MTKAVHFVVSGVVQGVGYRQSCRHVARSLGLVGWVRNNPEGTVELLAQGDEAAIDVLTAWVWDGPSHARVSGVESDVVAEDATLADFFIQPNRARPT